MRTLRFRILFGVLFPIVLFLPLRVGQAMDLDTDRPGMDYKSYDLSSPDPNLCERACKEDQNCKAWTYVKPGVQGPKARCWLKSGVPQAVKNTSCISGITPQVPPTSAAKPTQQKIESAFQRSQQPQVESKTFQGLQGQVQPVQLPQETRFKAMADQALQNAKTTAISKMRSHLQQNEQEIAVRMKRVAVRQTCDTPIIKSVFPAKVYPGESILIEGCGFPSKQGVVTLKQSTPSTSFLTSSSYLPDPVFPEFELLIESWTATTIKGRIPDKFSTPLLHAIPLNIRVSKGKDYIDVTGGTPTPSPAIMLQPELEVRGLQISTNYIALGKPQNCLAFIDFVPVGAPVCGVQEQTPKILHFSNYGCGGKDTIYLQNIQLRNYWTFNTYQFYYQCMSLSSNTPTYTGPCAVNWAKLDQNLGDIHGKQTLPNVTVSWMHNSQAGVAYTLLILIEGAKGTAGTDSWVACP